MASPDDTDPDLLDALERRARERADEADAADEETPDLIDALRDRSAADAGDGAPGDQDADPDADADEPEEGDPPDLTLIGYIARHDRPPAFTGEDDQPYTVDVDVEETDDPERPFAAFLVFVRWAQTGAGIMGHIESEDVAFGGSEAEAKEAALEISLYEAKAELDAAIRRRERRMGDG